MEDTTITKTACPFCGHEIQDGKIISSRMGISLDKVRKFNGSFRTVIHIGMMAVERFRNDGQDMANTQKVIELFRVEQERLSKKDNETRALIKTEFDRLEKQRKEIEDYRKSIREEEKLIQGGLESQRIMVQEELGRLQAMKDGQLPTAVKQEIDKISSNISQKFVDIESTINKFIFNPKLKGTLMEFQVGSKINNLNTGDGMEMLGGPSEEDILISVRNGDRIIGRIKVDSKNIKAWNRKYVPQMKGYLEENSIDLGIIVTNCMPKEAFGEGVYWDSENSIIICSPENIEAVYLSARFACCRTDCIYAEYNRKLNAVEKENLLVREISEILGSNKLKAHIQNILDRIRESDNMLYKLNSHVSKSIEAIKGKNASVMDTAHQCIAFENELQKAMGESV